MAYHGFKPAEQAIQIGADEILSSHISDGVIVNADINSSAAIATSKISGALTSVAGSHGLATSATTDTTNASNISSGTLAAARVATLNQSTTGQAGTVATIAGLAPNTATTQATQGAITSLGTLTGLTGGTGDLVWDTTTLVVDSSANQVGIGLTDINANAKLHIRGSDSGQNTSSNNTQLTVESSGTAGIQILTGTSNVGGFWIGDSNGSETGGKLYYSNSTDAWSFYNGGSTLSLTIASNAAATFAGDVTLGTKMKFIIGGTSEIKHDDGGGSLTLMGDQVNIKNRAGDETALSYNDGGGVSFGGDIKFTGTTAFNIGSRSSGASAWLGLGANLNNLKIGESDFTNAVAEFNFNAGAPILTINQKSAYNGIKINHHETGYWGSISTGESGYLTLLAGGNRGMDIRVDSQIRFFTQQNGTPVQRMTMDSAGEFGIGTQSPGALLHLNSDAGAGGSGAESCVMLMQAEAITINNGNSQTIEIAGTSSLFFIQQNASGTGYNSALFFGNYAAVGATVMLADPANQFSHTEGTSSKTNVYIDGYNNNVIIQNNSGHNKLYTVQVLAMTGQ